MSEGIKRKWKIPLTVYSVGSFVAITEEIEDGEKQKRASELVLIYPSPPVAKFRLLVILSNSYLL